MLAKVASAFDVKKNTTILYRFLAVSFLFTAILLFGFIAKLGWPQSGFGAVYAALAPLYYYIILLVLMSVLLPVFWLRKGILLALVFKIIVDTLLLADLMTFDVYRFHIDLLFINMAIYDFKGLGVSNWLIAMSVAAIAVIALINGYIFKKASSWQLPSMNKVNASIFIAFLFGQFIHIFGYEYKARSITQYTPYLPYYAPVTSYNHVLSMQQSFPSIFPERPTGEYFALDDILAGSAQGLLQYPKAELTFTKQEKPANVLIFVVESWRKDAMNAEITPNIHKFAQQNTQFANHFSGGSVTVNGLFSLMYGLHPVYREHMESAPFANQTQLTRMLEKQGYEIKAYTSSNLDRFNLKEMFFGVIDDENYFNPTSERPDVNDTEVINRVIADLSKPSDKPWFKFVFLTATHHSYLYPKEYERYTPISVSSEAYMLDKFTDDQPYRNDFKNSVLYMDKLFGDLNTALQQSADNDNTLVLVTSDHGEEFNDNNAGYWGHGSNFTEYQVAVPMIIQQPKSRAAQAPSMVSQMTGHVDVIPTIFEQVLAVNNPVSDYSNGFDLFALPNNRSGIISASYKDKAYIIGDFVYATGLSVESYSLKDLNQKNEQFNYKALNELKAEEHQFLLE